MPFGGSNSTSLNDWKDFKIGSGIALNRGVQALKVLFTGSSNSFELDNVSITIKTAVATNLAPDGIASQSTTGFGGVAERAPRVPR